MSGKTLATRVGEEFKAHKVILDTKADKSDTYTKSEVESKIVELAPATDISGKADITYVNSKVEELTNLAPETLDTFKEIADELSVNESAVLALTAVVGNKVDKEIGKGLSSEDFTATEKNKLSTVEANANHFVLSRATADILGGVKIGAGLTIDIDGVVSVTSGGTADSVEWAGVLNRPTTITGYGLTDVYSKSEINESLLSKADVLDLSGVAFSGNYNDLNNKPVIPTLLSGFTNDSGFLTGSQVDAKVQAIVGAAPEALNTLVEIATQLASDESAASALTTVVSGKADKATTLAGYGITNAYTKTESDTALGAKVTANVNITAGTATKITYDAKGLVLSGTTLAASDIPSLDATKITTGTLTVGTSGNAGTATKLATARTIATSGDVTGTATSFDGSGNITISTTLATITDSGTGTFKKITTDGKGRVTGTVAVAQADITALLGAGSITNTMLANGAVANLSGTNTGDETASTIKTKLGVTTLSGSNTGDQTITLTGDATGSGTGSFAVTLANSGVTAGTYKSVTVDGKGRITAGTNPTTLGGYSISDAYTKTQTDTAINTAIQNVIGAAPAALDTLVEIATQLANDESAVSALTTSVSNKVDKVAGKGLSTEDYTTDEKNKLAGITAGATANAGTLTGITAGAYLLGGTITGSGTIDVDATSTNNASKIVARDASGNFSANVITANTFSGTATYATNAGSAVQALNAVKLLNSRLINNVAFDGTADITITDDTKLSLAGGTMTGNLVIGSSNQLTVSGATTHQSSVRNKAGVTNGFVQLGSGSTFAAGAINLANGNIFAKTLTGNASIAANAIANLGTANSELDSFMLEITSTGTFTLSFDSSFKWAGGTAPALTANGKDVLGFYTYNGGTTWVGLVLAKDVK